MKTLRVYLGWSKVLMFSKCNFLLVTLCAFYIECTLRFPSLAIVYFETVPKEGTTLTNFSCFLHSLLLYESALLTVVGVNHYSCLDDPTVFFRHPNLFSQPGSFLFALNKDLYSFGRKERKDNIFKTCSTEKIQYCYWEVHVTFSVTSYNLQTLQLKSE